MGQLTGSHNKIYFNIHVNDFYVRHYQFSYDLSKLEASEFYRICYQIFIEENLIFKNAKFQKLNVCFINSIQLQILHILAYQRSRALLKVFLQLLAFRIGLAPLVNRTISELVSKHAAEHEGGSWRTNSSSINPVAFQARPKFCWVWIHLNHAVIYASWHHWDPVGVAIQSGGGFLYENLRVRLIIVQGTCWVENAFESTLNFIMLFLFLWKFLVIKPTSRPFIGPSNPLPGFGGLLANWVKQLLKTFCSKLFAFWQHELGFTPFGGPSLQEYFCASIF